MTRLEMRAAFKAKADALRLLLNAGTGTKQGIEITGPSPSGDVVLAKIKLGSWRTPTADGLILASGSSVPVTFKALVAGMPTGGRILDKAGNVVEEFKLGGSVLSDQEWAVGDERTLWVIAVSPAMDSFGAITIEMS